MTAAVVELPSSLQLIERGWLSSNSILCVDGPQATLVDSGYIGHAAQTVALIKSALAERRLASLGRLINTHSHSDHIGGNAALKTTFGCEIIIPSGMDRMITLWDEKALLLSAAGQRADRFAHDGVIAAQDEFEMGGLVWRALPAPGHDMTALVFYCAQDRLLISGDALWEDGFGIVFDALLDAPADAATAHPDPLAVTRETLEMIARLDVAAVIPGHGPAFGDVEGALARAFARLDRFESDPTRLARNAVKGAFIFNLLDLGRISENELPAYLASVPFFAGLNLRHFKLNDGDFAAWLLRELLSSGSVAVSQGWIEPLMAA